MRQKSTTTTSPSERLVKNIRRATRKHYSAEEKIRVVLDGLRGESSIAELCRREGIAEGLYYSWSKEFLEAGKRRLAGDTARAATSSEVTDLRREARALKEVVAEQALERNSRLGVGQLLSTFQLGLHDAVFGRQVFVPRQQLLVRRPRHVGQDARPIHNGPPAPTLDDVVTGLLENCTGTPNEPLAEAGQLTDLEAVSVFFALRGRHPRR